MRTICRCLKKNIRNHPKPLQQFANRLTERNDIQHLPNKNHPFNKEEVSIKHNSDKVPQNIRGMNYTQYKVFKSK